MNIPMRSLGLAGALLAASLFGACSNTARGLQEDTAQNADRARDASAEAAAKSEQAAEDAKAAAERAADATKDAVGAAGRAAREAAENATEATRDAAHDAATAARDASADAEVKSRNAAASAANSLDGAQQTLQIKTALIADKVVDASGIDVDTNGATKTVTLKGRVPSDAQKAEAERIAKSKAPDYKVVNLLVIG